MFNKGLLRNTCIKKKKKIEKHTHTHIRSRLENEFILNE